MAKDIQLLTLDLDNTLWDVDKIIIRAEKEMRQWLADAAPQSLDHYNQENLPSFRQQVVDRFPDKVHDLSFMRIEVLTLVMEAAGYEAQRSRDLADAAFDVFFQGRNRVEFFPGAVESLTELSARYTIIALTNGNADIERAGLSDWLSGAISSADVGKSKPSAEMFHAPLSQFGINAGQAIHIGDNPIDDVQGARNVGMHTVWVNLEGSSEPGDNAISPADETVLHKEVSHLNQLSTAIAEIAAG
ncbi:MAG: HAD-IA family hydrolase [Pseudomonadales bacterium]|nr:HAD-IA family hydrolase [Pseudomonadales bacterium]